MPVWHTLTDSSSQMNKKHFKMTSRFKTLLKCLIQFLFVNFLTGCVVPLPFKISIPIIIWNFIVFLFYFSRAEIKKKIENHVIWIWLRTNEIKIKILSTNPVRKRSTALRASHHRTSKLGSNIINKRVFCYTGTSQNCIHCIQCHLNE